MFYFRLNLKQKFPMERNSQFSDLADSGIRLVFALLAGWTQFFSQSKCPEAAGDFILGKFYSGLKPISTNLKANVQERNSLSNKHTIFCVLV